MAIQRTHKQSDLEKRLKLLNQQLYGKRSDSESAPKRASTSVPPGITFSLPNTTVKLTDSSNTKSISDVAYLRTDLLRITIFAAIALGAQVLLYYLVQNNLINLKF